MLAKILSAATIGIEAKPIEIEVDITKGPDNGNKEYYSHNRPPRMQFKHTMHTHRFRNICSL